MTRELSPSTRRDPPAGGGGPLAELSEHWLFNSLLHQWGREGLRVSWPEVEAAYRLSLEAEGHLP